MVEKFASGGWSCSNNLLRALLLIKSIGRAQQERRKVSLDEIAILGIVKSNNSKIGDQSRAPKKKKTDKWPRDKQTNKIPVRVERANALRYNASILDNCFTHFSLSCSLCPGLYFECWKSHVA